MVRKEQNIHVCWIFSTPPPIQCSALLMYFYIVICMVSFRLIFVSTCSLWKIINIEFLFTLKCSCTIHHVRFTSNCYINLMNSLAILMEIFEYIFFQALWVYQFLPKDLIFMQWKNLNFDEILSNDKCEIWSWFSIYYTLCCSWEHHFLSFSRTKYILYTSTGILFEFHLHFQIWFV